MAVPGQDILDYWDEARAEAERTAERIKTIRLECHAILDQAKENNE